MGEAAPRGPSWVGGVEATGQAGTTRPVDAPTVATTSRSPRTRGHQGRLRDRTLDPSPSPRHDPTPFRGHLPCALPLGSTERLGLVGAGACRPGSRARRGLDPGRARPGLAAHQKKARRKGAVIVFIDETGFSFQIDTGTTWAPEGQTPELRRVSKRRQVSTAIGLTTSGRVCKKHFDHAIHGEDTVAHLEHLGRQVRGPKIIIWDRLQAHRSQVVKAFLSEHPEIDVEW